MTRQPLVASCSFSTGGTSGPAGRDKDSVKGRGCPPSARSVASTQLDIVKTKLAEALPGGLSERRMTFDRVNFVGNLCEWAKPPLAPF
jgi:hypothetical protein